MIAWSLGDRYWLSGDTQELAANNSAMTTNTQVGANYKTPKQGHCSLFGIDTTSDLSAKHKYPIFGFLKCYISPAGTNQNIQVGFKFNTVVNLIERMIQLI